MTIQWTIEAEGGAALLTLMQTAADSALLAEGVSQPCAVHVTLTDDPHIREINRAYRQKDAATDVLSFPTVSYRPGQHAGQAGRKLRQEFDVETGACFLGDIIISLDHAAAQAAEYGHIIAREAAYLLTHGLFHLMGYDHMEPDDKKEMRAMEEKALQQAGLSREEGQTVSDEALLALARTAMTRAYAPYSHYRVGAALLTTDGRVYQGCNIENASFGLSNCAERTAVFKAVSDGAMCFAAIAIASEKSAPWPCGACRQVLSEFAPNIRVLVTWGDGQTAQASLEELLPHGFGPKDLENED